MTYSGAHVRWQNNRIPFLWGIEFFLMLNDYTVTAMQHGCILILVQNLYSAHNHCKLKNCIKDVLFIAFL